MYRERPSGVAPGAILWVSVAQDDGLHRILPDGCLDLLWFGGRLVAAGPDTRAALSSAPPGSVTAGLRFAPGTGPALLGVRADEVRDQRVPLDALWPAARVARAAEPLVRLHEQAADDDTGAVSRWSVAAETAAALEQLCRTLAADPARPADPLVCRLAALLRHGTPVGRAAEQVGLSPRQLLRRSLPAFGYGPKTLARILRAQRALALARTGATPAAIGAAAGYADQAHLSREIKALTGVPLSTLLHAA